MKYVITLLILNFAFCLKAEQSNFDLNSGTGGLLLAMDFFLSMNTTTPPLQKKIQDINGDGFADLVVSAPSFISSTQAVDGRVYVFNGSATGISQTSAANASQVLAGSAGRKFGSSVAVIDINNDGFSDLVVCEYKDNTSTNSAYYYLGSPSGLVSQVLIDQVSTLNSEYCSSMAVGDFNNDGYGDVAIGETGNAGLIYIYSGTTNGLNVTVKQTISRSTSTPTNFGGSITLGDINGDGYLDLVSRTVSSPSIYSFLGSPTGFSQSTNITLTASISSLVLGDFNGDGKADLAVGEPTYSGTGINQGRIHIFLSNGNTLNTTASQTIDGDISYILFPKTLFAHDINNDGVVDLIAGNSTEVSNSVTSGSVYFFYGCINVGLCNANGTASAKANLKITGGSVLNLGYTISMKDLNGDDFPDFITSTNSVGGASPSDGAVYIFNGTATGISATSASSGAPSVITGTIGSGEQFGTSLY